MLPGAVESSSALQTVKERPHGRLLSSEERQYNQKLSALRFIVENVFGRLQSLWNNERMLHLQ